MILTITPGENGRVLRNLLQSKYKMSRRLLRQLVQQDGIQRKKETVFLNQHVNEGDIILVTLPNESSSLEMKQMDLDIRYEDAEILIVNKSAGVLSHPTAWEREDSVLSGLLHYLSPEERIPHCVHRLDRETSGLVMFAKHAHYHHVFDYALQHGLMHRSYTALVHVSEAQKSSFTDDDWGKWRTIRLPIAINRNQPSRRVISMDGQASVTHYRPIIIRNNVALVELRLETGRTHQIRLHLASIGLPIIGDPHYDWSYCMLPGGQERARDSNEFAELSQLIGRQALHAFRLTWTHPVTNVTVSASAAPPTDFRFVARSQGITDNEWDLATEQLFSLSSPD
ncbi:RluA family pseudouridine synthase [Alicyclobacillus sp. SO9]|uniref:RluA family pseudouridine synthase n=1 Tax=Alicyclobacillus sp. SO9 TaxID=2665646 RepID=UPI0018E88D13|nr:RluA family pseudouridine synthase [Alicyclobacillus sp. SO9]QQE76805.1 RluA family pseudouridine synthase [Alicyclobacillus sp. SO9]